MAHEVRHSVCPKQGKRKYRGIRDATTGARNLARELNRFGIFAQDMYVYVCPHCRRIHLTRDAEHHGVPHKKVFTAPTEDLQRWAMGLIE